MPSGLRGTRCPTRCCCKNWVEVPALPSSLDLPRLILDLRADLRRRFQFHLDERQDAFRSWLVTTGVHEYASLYNDAALARWLRRPSQFPGISMLQEQVWQARQDVQAAHPLPDDGAGFVDWFYLHGVGEHGLWPWLTPAERQRVCLQEGPWQAQLLQRATDDLLQAEPPLPATQRPWGVNLIGYAYGQLGIGEDVRMAARALQAAGVPVCMVNFKPGNDVAQNDRSMHDCVVSGPGPYAVNVFCLTAMEHGRFFAEQGPRQLQGRYNIGYWPWELGRWPDAWAQLVHLVDEVWVSTRHTHDAVAPVCATLHRPVPVHVMPMAVELGPVERGSRATVRQRWRLPLQARLMVFTFDLNSSIHRKNPQAVVESFLRAFPRSDWAPEQVGLVIKVHPPRRRHAAWDALKRLAAQDDRLHIIEQTLSRPALLALYRACDVFVSLHRAEGFGRGIAEALQLGLHVVTTRYSGNVDFCSAPEFAGRVDLIDYRLVRVRPGQYPFGAGQVWANADLNHAARCLRAYVLRWPPGRSLPRQQVPEGGWPLFHSAQIGLRFAARLGQVRAGLADADLAWPAV